MEYDSLFIIVLGIMAYGIFSSITSSTTNSQKYVIEKKIGDMGAELIDVKEKGLGVNINYNPYYRAAMEIEKKLEEEGKIEKRKRDNIAQVYKVEYKLGKEEKVMYLIKHKNYVQIIGEEYWRYDWVEELE
ncbi:MAG: hypothetical protein N4A62_05375 [Marinisporobacter sp.]|jgi:CII-binding regulator of phage lambda lysogenization HflD|nr:hypothetical protein [Marinisporobacter sp.]